MENKCARIEDLETRAQYFAGIYRTFACSVCADKIMSNVSPDCEKDCKCVAMGAAKVIEELLNELRASMGKQSPIGNGCEKCMHVKDEAKPKYAPNNASKLINDEIWQFKNLRYGHRVPRKPWFEALNEGDWVFVSRFPKKRGERK